MTRPSVGQNIRQCVNFDLMSTHSDHLEDDSGCLCRACGIWNARRAFVLAAASATTLPAAAQVDVGKASGVRKLVPAEELEQSAKQQYRQMLAQALKQRSLAPQGHPQLEKLHTIGRRIIPFTAQWNKRASSWNWQVNLIGSKEINAFCMPGGKIAFYTGILDRLRLTDDEIAMVMGHEMAHALREHARARIAKSEVTNLGVTLAAQLLGLKETGAAVANVGAQLLSLKFSRSDESEADLVGLELAARAGYNPEAAVSLWRKMGQATGNGGINFLSTHPTGPRRIRDLEANVPRVNGLYQQARRG